MEARSVKHVVGTAFTLFLCAAPAGYAAVFKWTDTEGHVTYSTQPPSNPDKVRNFAQLDIDTQRAQANIASPAPAQERAATTQEPSLSRPDTWLKGTPRASALVERSAKTESATSIKTEAETLPREPDTVTRDADSASRAPPRGVREAARDPCLRSSDPKCYERNKDRYHPYLGYAPGVASAATAPVGAISGAPGVGSVGGHVNAAAVSTQSGKVETPLIFLDSPQQQKKRRWR